MPDDRHPVYRSIRDLQAAFARKELSPVEVAESVLDRIQDVDPELHAYMLVTPDIARQQAQEAEEAYARGEWAPLLGIPVSIKDVFHVEGRVTTMGSRVFEHEVSTHDSGVTRRLRQSGGVFVGKTNTAEFGQSATTDNLLQPDTANPWDPTRTPGGSSGGAAASVAAGLATVAVGSDGGGSIRIPAAFTGLFGLKPTHRLCPDENGFVAMSHFVAPGPLTWRVEDARTLLGVLVESAFPRRELRRTLRVAYCPRPEGWPVDADVRRAVATVAAAFADLGHRVEEVDLPLDGWKDVFGPLVLADELTHRGDLLVDRAHDLTVYERRTLEVARDMDPARIERAHRELPGYRARIAQLFVDYDLLLTPTTAVPAFELGQRPDMIDDEAVDSLWGPFPFAVPFNVAGVPAASIPCGMADGLPVGAQLVAAAGHEWLLLDAAEQLEEVLAFDPTPVMERWATAAASGPR